MKLQILTDTTFFKVLGGKGMAEVDKIQKEYHNFVSLVIELCHNSKESNDAMHALVFAETELQFHPLLHSENEGGCLCLYIKKALSFIRKMMQLAKASVTNAVPTPSSTKASSKNKADKVSPIRWTGKASDLVEILYGIDELGCINDGETPLKEVAAYFYKMLGVNAKECYHIYADMKMRKNESRTYFLDKMQERVNRRMDLDEERERMRR